MYQVPVVVVTEKANRYSIGVVLGYLLKRCEEGTRFKFIFTEWSDASRVITFLGGPHILMTSLLTSQVAERYQDIVNVVELSRRLHGVTLAGGPHASGDPYGTVLRLGFDVAFVGEAEISFTLFVQELLSGGDPLSIDGIVTISEDGVRARFHGPKVKSLDEVPPFCEELGLLNPIEIMRGCPHACRYCQVSYMFGASPRFRGVESVVRYAKVLLSRGIKDIRFISPNGFHYSPPDGSLIELLEAMNREVRSRGGRVYLGTFPSEVRPEFVTEELLMEVRGLVDNKRIAIGAQTGSERLLKELRRGHSTEDALNAVSIARRYGFGVDVDYILGLPGEDEDDVEQTIRHIERVTELGGRIRCHAFMPLPGTPYSFAPPGRIPSHTKRKLIKLIGRGALWGQWLKQEDMAERIAKLRDSLVIVVNYPRVIRLLSEEKLPVKERSSSFLTNLRRLSAHWRAM